MDRFGQIIVPAPESDTFVELAAPSATGTQFRKHLLNMGPLIHPETGSKINIDEAFWGQLKRNFDNGVSIVQVPVADENNRHSEDPLRNLGEVVDLQREGDKIYAVMDIRDPAAVGKMGKTLLGASAFISMNYKDSRTGDRVGPALLHACVTNRPYVTGLEGYEEVIAATDTSDELDVAVLTAPGPAEVNSMDRDELIAALKDEHGIDVEALQAAAMGQPQVSELTAALTAALQATPVGDQLRLSGNGAQVSVGDLVGAVAELAEHNVKLSSSVIGLQKRDVEREVDGLVGKGFILPAKREVMVNLALTNRSVFDELLPDQPIVPVGEQSGLGGEDGKQQDQDAAAEVARLAEQYSGKILALNGGRASSN